MILDNILHAIGKTPIVKLNRIGQSLNCNLFAKCEFVNPGGSIKDRIGYNMIEEAEKEVAKEEPKKKTSNYIMRAETGDKQVKIKDRVEE